MTGAAMSLDGSYMDFSLDGAGRKTNVPVDRFRLARVETWEGHALICRCKKDISAAP